MKRLSHYSQHFIRNPRLIKELVGHSTLKADDLVLDIGAGSGVISSVLAESCRSVIAVEFEPRTAAKLRVNMEKYPNVTVREGDFMEMALPDQPYKVFANIPFHLSSQIVRKLLEAPNPPDAIYLIVQKQFAHKLAPDPRRFTGQLGMIAGPYYAARIRKRLQRTDFWPHPNVDTVLLELLQRSSPLLPRAKLPAFRECIEQCFSDPKKFTKMPIRAAQLPNGIKPSQMTVEQWVDLFSRSAYARQTPARARR